jgi:adenine deaminase
MIKEELRAALGEAPLDKIILNGKIVNVFSDEILDNWIIGIKNSKIVYIGKSDKKLIENAKITINAKGKFVTPGFIETHTHICQMFRLQDFSKKSLLSGTTTVITETAEFSNSYGKDAVKTFIKEAKLQPIRLFTVLPPLTPPFPEFETSIGLTFEDYKELLNEDNVLGLGEFYWNRILNLDKFHEELIEYTLSLGKTVHGHSSGAKGKKLNAYISMGIKSCHEPISVDEVIERIRLGLHLILREGSVRCDFSNIAGFRERLKDLRMITVSTDGVTPTWLEQKGTLKEIARRAVKLGFSPIEVVKMLTLNASYVFNLQDKIGSLSPGKLADIAIFNDLKEFNVDTVLVGGEIKVENSEICYNTPIFNYPENLKKSVKIKKVTPENFIYYSKRNKVKVRAIKYLNFLLTGIEEVELNVEKEQIKINTDDGLLKYVIFERYGSNRIVKGFIKDLGFKNYTYAGTLNWEANQLIVIGADETDMAIAVNRIAELQGGIVLVAGGKIIVEIPLPICGVMSELSLEQLQIKEETLNKLLLEDGCRMENPSLWLQTLSFSGLPYYKLTDKGLLDVKNQKLIDIFLK